MNPEEIFIIIVLAAVVIGPSHIPKYAEQLGRLVRTLRDMARGATRTLKDELGPEAEDLDFSKLDPRQYDPRRIVRDALREDESPTAPSSRSTSSSSSSTSSSTSSSGVAAAGTSAAVAAAAASSGATDDEAETGAADPPAEDVDPLAAGAPFDDEAT